MEHPGASIHEFLADVTLASPIDRWDQQEGAVTLMTLHAAKGLEFPVVFVVALEEGLLPHSRANNNDKELEEERRLLFVGITRAQRQLYLSRCRIRTFRGQQAATFPSRFLDELPDGADRLRGSLGDRAAPAEGSAGGGSGSSPGTRLPSRATAVPARSVPPDHGGRAGRRRRARPAGQAARTRTPCGPGTRSSMPSSGSGESSQWRGREPRRKGTVAFTVGGPRTFVLSLAPLRLLSRAADRNAVAGQRPAARAA